VLWSDFQHGACSEEEFAISLDRRRFGSGVPHPSPGSASACQSLHVKCDPTLIENENPTARGRCRLGARNKAALALELGMTPGRVNCCMSGGDTSNEGSCLRLTNITRGAAVAVIRLAGDTKSAAHATRVHCPTGELAGRLHQWPHRLGGWSVTDQAIALSVLDVVAEAVSAPRRKRTPPGGAERRAPPRSRWSVSWCSTTPIVSFPHTPTRGRGAWGLWAGRAAVKDHVRGESPVIIRADCAVRLE